MFAPPNVLRCTTSPASRRFGRVDPHRGGPASVCADRPPHCDGWVVAAVVLRELFAGYYGQRLPAPASYRSFITWLADRDLDAARTAWRAVFDGFDNPRWWPADRWAGGEAWPR
ncbi:linear gramicidin synthetase subunit C domain protein [Mycobacterium xenopi 4042]|uniref:Linear gramicidin synthetase subunit C domain protein n=1 Tax=Mycobacterium xenopi 4042 TaxID=1299334 RepID=X8E8J3_MYCXE|nr:linear gramicidin synthetase subunit C domain protein [Mycobacterium xenopi 4042]